MTVMEEGFVAPMDFALVIAITLERTALIRAALEVVGWLEGAIL